MPKTNLLAGARSLPDGTVSLSFTQPRAHPDMTLYRGEGWYGIRAGRNFECLRKLRAGQA
ncbi:MAG: hypothetical protein QM777_02910 [Pseudorhodoferax sp.]